MDGLYNNELGGTSGGCLKKRYRRGYIGGKWMLPYYYMGVIGNMEKNMKTTIEGLGCSVDPLTQYPR